MTSERNEFSRRLYIRQSAEDKAREARLRQMFARLAEQDGQSKPKPPITSNMSDHYALWRRREERREARQKEEP